MLPSLLAVTVGGTVGGTLALAVAPHGGVMHETEGSGSVIVVVIVLVVVSLVIWGILWLIGVQTKFLKARNARLAALATLHGLTVRPQNDNELFFAEGESHAGVALRIWIERMPMPEADRRRSGAGDTTFNVTATCRGPRPVVLVLDRQAANRTDIPQNLHALSTGNPAFDAHFITWADDDIAAIALLASGPSEALLALGVLRGEGMREVPWGGIDTFKVGGQVALTTQMKIGLMFFQEGSVERFVETALRIAAGA